MSKIFTVFGATGNQGGSVVKHILEHPELSKTYKIRAITRDVSKPASQALKAKGAEVVAANLNDRDSVCAAIKGSSVVFGVTNFWEQNSTEVEIAQGKAMADASKDTGVERFIWSSLPNVTKETNGENTSVLHFDSKAAVESYAREIGVPLTVFMPGFFMSNIDFQGPNDEGAYAWTSPFKPETKVPLLEPAVDTGAFVAAALLAGDSTLGKRILGASGYVTASDIAKVWSEATGKKGSLNSIPLDVFKSFLPPSIADDLAGNMQLVISPGYYVGEPASGVDDSVKLVKDNGLKLTSWKEFVEKKNATA
ncbi:NmrA family transcriptional regulator [Tothia fuscella]|uniref:NmrA family transcriptional regulator n=1 Tax=Tothia fuscella TaxID=1048955 RepID=A0A9P4NLY6_9PEZI|nr:NmrA family transcriptional regulator [Tothia fuscella]